MKKIDFKLIDLNIFPKKKNIKIFFGEYNGFQRYDIIKYPFAKKIEENMRQAFWTPEEISLISDRENFKDLPHGIQEIIISNLLFQTLMDSAQNRGLDTIMSELVTSSQWEAVFKTQAFFELIHSLSYSHIIREMFSSNAEEIFDRIYKVSEIKTRTDKEIKIYSEVKEWMNGRRNWSDEEAKKQILKLLIHIYFLEGLKFYVSFLVTYIINYRHKDAIAGVAKIIKLINFDEDMHVGVVAGLIKILKNDESEGFSHLFKNNWVQNLANDIVKGIVEDEIHWGEYLLGFYNIPGLTLQVLTNFMEYYANDRMKAINLQPLFPKAKKDDTVTWFQIYKDINKDNTAQQEATALNYNIGNMNIDWGRSNIENELNKLVKKIKTK